MTRGIVGTVDGKDRGIAPSRFLGASSMLEIYNFLKGLLTRRPNCPSRALALARTWSFEDDPIRQSESVKMKQLNPVLVDEGAPRRTFVDFFYYGWICRGKSRVRRNERKGLSVTSQLPDRER